MTAAIVKSVTKLADKLELTAIVDAATARLAEIRETERAEAVAKMTEIAATLGLSPNELLGVKQRRNTSGNPLPVKYRHTDNAELTWTGQGRRPTWFAEAEKAGLVTEVTG